MTLDPPHYDLTDVTGVVLVGGWSRRMGQDKIFLSIDGTPLISHIHRKMLSLFERVLVIGHHRPEFDTLNITSHGDLVPDCGILGGIYTGLSLSQTHYIFAVAGDMPFLDRDLIIEIASDREGSDAVIPMGPNGMEPLFAVYSRSCLDSIRESLAERSLKVMKAVHGMRIATPEILPSRDGSPDPLANLNVPEDLDILKR